MGFNVVAHVPAQHLTGVLSRNDARGASGKQHLPAGGPGHMKLNFSKVLYIDMMYQVRQVVDEALNEVVRTFCRIPHAAALTYTASTSTCGVLEVFYCQSVGVVVVVVVAIFWCVSNPKPHGSVFAFSWLWTSQAFACDE